MLGAFTFLAGVLGALAAAGTPRAAGLWVASGLAVLVLLTPLRGNPWLRRLALFLGGMALAFHAVVEWQSLRAPAASGEVRLLLEGTVSTVPARSGAALRFDAQVRIVDGPGRDGRLRHARLAWRQPAIEPRAGERWRWLVRLSSSNSRRNFVGVEIDRLLFRDRVHLSGEVLPAALNQRLLLANSSWDTLRARIALRIADHVADPDAAALLTALAVGLTSGMSTDQWRVFNATGTTHLVAISGLHVTLFAVLALLLARLLWRCPPIHGFIDREPFALACALVAAGGYSLLAGWSVPTQRTWLMLAIFALARASARHVGAGRTWALALLAVLLLDVFAPLAAGFWLSFIAVGVLLSIDATALTKGAGSRSLLKLQLAVMLALAPLTIAVFGAASLVGFAVNLIAIPFVSFVFVPLVLTGAVASLALPQFCGPPFALAAWLYERLWPCMVWAAELDIALWRAAPAAWWFAMCVPGMLLLLLRWPWRLRMTGLGLLLALALPPSRFPPSGVARVSVLDTGRGAAVLIVTHSHVLLYDTGDSWNTGGVHIARLVIPALAAFGARRVDLLVLPALNPDRAQAAAALAQEAELGGIVTGGEWPATSLPVSACGERRHEWDGVLVELLAAGATRRHCMLRLSIDGHALLIGGDLDVASEQELLARVPRPALDSEVHIVSRQASSHGSSAQWIETIRPGLVIATGGIAGSQARRRALERWRASGARIVDTHVDGALQFEIGTAGVGALASARATRYPFAWRRVE